MLFYLTTAKHQYTIRQYLESYGAPLTGWIKPVSYEELFQAQQQLIGTYLFSDLERLSPRDSERAAYRWHMAGQHGCRLLNHPTRALRRYELLRTLHEQGLNSFNVYRLTERRQPSRFPVFLRNETAHGGALTPLLHTPRDLAGAIEQLDRQGMSREDILIVEFCDTGDGHGVYRKYAAFRVADRIIPRHIFFKRKWLVKGWELLDEPFMVEERTYLRDNPHQDLLRAVFTTAQIDYGRIDYALKDGKLQVWEINTNPVLVAFENGGGPPREAAHTMFAGMIQAAFESLNVSSPSRLGLPPFASSGT